MSEAWADGSEWAYCGEATLLAGIPDPGLTKNPAHRSRGTSLARVAMSARSAQANRGRATWRRSYASWRRSTRISASLAAACIRWMRTNSTTRRIVAGGR
jgi:hypothetical protein